MPSGDGGFSPAERHQIDKAIRDAETVCRYEFSVYVGMADGAPRPFAERLHGALTAPDKSVLIMLDPVQRALEVVTGEEVRRHLTDDEVRVAVSQMQSEFAAGELVDGVVRGINMLASYARKPPTLHA